MYWNKFVIIIGLLFISFCGNTQNAATFDQKIEVLNFYTKQLLEDYDVGSRQQAFDTLPSLLAYLLKDEASFKQDLSALKGIAIQQPEDKSFKVLTWQFFKNDSTYIYGGCVQKSDGKIYLLEDKTTIRSLPMYETMYYDDWYGALYYNIQSFKHKGQSMYLLMGYDAFSFFDKRKLIDVLYFDFKTGEPLFGAPVLEYDNGWGKKEWVNRFILEYASNVSLKLNWDKSLNLIVFDNLTAGGVYKGRVSNITDGSYSGLKLEKGRWKFVDKLFNQIQDDPLYDGTQKDRKSQRNLFGRVK